MDTKIIATVQKAGYAVYMRKTTDTWLLFTDGTNIGYLQDGWRGLALSTVHIPNRTSGTGYGLTEFMSVNELTPTTLAKAFVHSPDWADGRSRASIRKWKNIQELMARDSFNSGYGLVPAMRAAS